MVKNKGSTKNKMFLGIFSWIKTIFIFFIFSVIFITSWQMFAPQYFENNTIKKCLSKAHMRGLCANKEFSKGESIGHLSTILSTDRYEDTKYGQFINHADENNVDLYGIEYNGRIDVYGYANKKIGEGEELTADYNSEYAPTPNFKKNEPSKIVRDFFK
jgi:hypothetical protein